MRRKKRTNASHKHKNLFLILVGILAALAFSRNEAFRSFLLQMGSLGYLGAFLGGMLFVSTLSAASGALILLILAERLSPIEIALVAGLGAVVGDLFVLRFVKDDLIEEVKPIYDKFGGKYLGKLLHTRYFRWTLPVIGALIIASPLPDELGVTLLGIAKMNTAQFALVSFFLNALGILAVLSASFVIKV